MELRLVNMDEEEYLKRMNERMMNLPEGQIIILEKNVPIGQLGLMIQEFEGGKIGYVNFVYLIPEYRGNGIGKTL